MSAALRLLSLAALAALLLLHGERVALTVAAAPLGVVEHFVRAGRRRGEGAGDPDRPTDGDDLFSTDLPHLVGCGDGAPTLAQSYRHAD